MKRVLSIQSLSCFGKSSLTVALPVLAAMGCSCTALPTAVLSTHTGYPEPHRRDMTAELAPIAAHWQQQGICFDAVMTGYLADPAQAEEVLRIVGDFDGLRIVDPAMGDGGKLYRGLPPEHVEAMASVCRRGAILLPNVTEAALLTGIPYRSLQDPAYIQQLMDGMFAFGPEAVVITGVSAEPGKTGFSCALAGGESVCYQTALVGKGFHGTGDLFSAVLTGAVLRGKGVPEAARLAAAFTERVLQRSTGPEREGIAFEPELPWLWQQLQERPSVNIP